MKPSDYQTEPVPADCPACLGYRHLTDKREPSADPRDPKCDACSGTGRAAGPPPARPQLSPGLVALRDQCGLLILPAIVGKNADGTPLWSWGVWDAGTGKQLAWSCRHSPETYEQRLWDFLTGYATGMAAMPF